MVLVYGHGIGVYVWIFAYRHIVQILKFLSWLVEYTWPNAIESTAIYLSLISVFTVIFSKAKAG